MFTKIKKKTFVLAVFTAMFALPTWAVRPFITDDATLIGLRRAELASWTFISGKTMEFWHNYTMNLTNRFEIQVSGFWGFHRLENDDYRKLSYTAPLIQGKFLFRDYVPNGLPGVTIAAGSDLPFGKGAFVSGGYGAFSFLSITQCIGNDEEALFHANIGGTYLRQEAKNHTGLTWGVGMQIKAYKGLHGVAEIVSGDPYMHGAGSAYQLGIRYFFNDALQVDLAFGKGLGGENRMSSWMTCGIRYILSFNKSGNYARNGRRISQ